MQKPQGISATAIAFACVMTVSPAWAQTQRDEAAMPPLRSLFFSVPADIVHLGTGGTLKVLGGGTALALAFKPHDPFLARRAASWNRLEGAFDAGDMIGRGVMQVGGAFGVYLTGRLAGSPRTATLGAYLFRAQLLNGVMTQGIKRAVRRKRPDGGRLSFPSGHTSAGFATAAVIQREFGWRAGVPAYGAAAYIAVSRLSENKHFASDVAFGASIGIIAGRAVTIGRGRGKVAIAPFASSGRRGIQFTVIDVADSGPRLRREDGRAR